MIGTDAVVSAGSTPQKAAIPAMDANEVGARLHCEWFESDRTARCVGLHCDFGDLVFAQWLGKVRRKVITP